MRDTRLGAQRQLVGVVTLDRAVPVEVVGGERCHGDDRRAVGQIGNLIARRLDDPEVGRWPRGGVPWRSPDVAAHRGLIAQAGQEMPGDSRRGALPLAARDAGHVLEGDVLQPEPEPTAHRYPGAFELAHLGAVAADARALDHHVTGEQGVQPARPGGQYLRVTRRLRAARRAFGGRRMVVDQHGLDAHRPQAMQAGRPLDAQPPDADLCASERGPGGQRAHSAPVCDGHRGERGNGSRGNTTVRARCRGTQPATPAPASLRGRARPPHP